VGIASSRNDSPAGLLPPEFVIIIIIITKLTNLHKVGQLGQRFTVVKSKSNKNET